ncbi:hypothetical protein MWU50_10405 [Flavobacteriaceae bacterium S0862]|nr:hypothetical protein [Flavobacteriaceae bacterium S0862]
MIAILVEYIKVRIHLVQLIGLTLLMSILVLSTKNTLVTWVHSMLFLIASFIVFRIFDDAFSVKTDRVEHPERTYLIPQKFKLFKIITTIIIGVYLLSIWLLFPTAFLIIFLLVVSSLILYLLFAKKVVVLKLIPLVKYPILLNCVSLISFNEIELGILLSSFLLMAGFDSFDAVKRNSNRIWQPLLLLFCCSLLLYKPWLNYIDILFSLLPLILIYIIRNESFVRYFSIVYFPITFFILTHL